MAEYQEFKVHNSEIRAFVSEHGVPAHTRPTGPDHNLLYYRVKESKPSERIPQQRADRPSREDKIKRLKSPDEEKKAHKPDISPDKALFDGAEDMNDQALEDAYLRGGDGGYYDIIDNMDRVVVIAAGQGKKKALDELKKMIPEGEPLDEDNEE